MSLLTILDSGSGAGGSCITPPTLQNVSPAVGTELTRHQAVSFESIGTSAQQEMIAAEFANGDIDLVWFSGSFVPKYASSSTRTAVTSGFSYSIVPAVGWVSAPTLHVISANTCGGIETASYAYQLAATTVIVSGSGDDAPDTTYSFTEVTNLEERGKAELLKQFLTKPRIKAVLCAVLAELQEAETALFEITEALDVDSAQGAWLDKLGNIMGLTRLARTDAAYRQAISVEAAVLSSSGVPSELISVAQTLADGSAVVEFDEPGFATVIIRIFQTWTTAEAIEAMATLIRMVSAGVNFQGVYSLSPETELFQFASGSTLETSSTQGFANAGQTTGGKLAGVYAKTGS